MEVRVLNIKDINPLREGSAVYIGRGSKWGNPFIIGKDGNRTEVIAQFRAYAEKRLVQEPEWLEPLRGKDLTCYCYPERCHGDVIVSLIEAVPTLSE